MAKKHFAAGLDFFDEEFGPGSALRAAFVNAAAMESLAKAIADLKLPLTASTH